LRDLFKTLSSANVFDILHYLRKHPNSNASKIAAALGLHVFTVQKHLETLEKYGIVESEVVRSVGRPSKRYRYVGGSVEVNVDDLLQLYTLKDTMVRERPLNEAVYDCDIGKERVRRLLFKPSKRKVVFDEVEGKVLWFVPPPDSEGKPVEEIARETGLPLIQVLRAVKQLVDMGFVELVTT